MKKIKFKIVLIFILNVFLKYSNFWAHKLKLIKLSFNAATKSPDII